MFRRTPHALSDGDSTGRVPLIELFLILLLSLVWADDADARDQLVRWLAPTDNDVAGYRVYEGTTPGDYTLHEDLGPVTLLGRVGTTLVTGLDDQSDRYIAVTAYDFAGNESAFPTPLFSPRGMDSNPPTGVLLDENFENRAVGTPLPDWEALAFGAPTTPTAYFPIHVGGNQVEVTYRPGNTHLLHSGPDSESWLSYDYEGRMRLGSDNGAIGVTAYGSPPASFFLLRGWAGSTFQLLHTTGSGMSGGSCTGRSDTSLPVQSDRWYRFQLRTRTIGLWVIVLGRVWEDGAPTPTGWSVSCLAAPGQGSLSGPVGLWSYRAANGPNQWDDLLVDTDLELGPAGETCAVDADCDDGNACTGIEACIDGRCSAGDPLVCADANECQVGGCDAVEGCVYTSQDGLPCGNEDICDGIDVCVSGTCETYDPPFCTGSFVCGDLYCDQQLGCGRTPHPDGTPCTLAGVPGTCTSGACLP